MGETPEATSRSPLAFGTGAGRQGPVCSVLTLRLPPAPEDLLAQLLHVLQDLQEAHSRSPASSAPLEPNRLLELQT